MMLARKQENQDEKPRRVHFDKIKFDHVISIRIDRVDERRSSLDYLENLFPDLPLARDQVEKQVESLKNKKRGEIFRGKFEIQFMCKFLGMLKDDLCNQTPNFFHERRKIGFSIPDARNVLSEFSHFADNPECLRKFLHKYACE